MTARTVLFTCVVLAASFSAQAQDTGTATDNHCWGDISSDFAQLGLMGEHSRRNSTMRPEQQPRKGVGNVSKDDHGPLSEGGQGDHAVEVGGQIPEEFGGPLICD
jgi:hypothetical protein